MQQLTQEQAERCARVCGLEPMCCDGDTVPREWGYCIREGERLVKYEKETNQLSLNPFFWFPRLWEKLRECRRIPGYTTGITFLYGEDLAEDCIGLCSAIEALEQEAKE